MRHLRPYVACIMALWFALPACRGQLTLHTGDIGVEPGGEGRVVLRVKELNGYSREAGKPMLPVYTQVVAVSDEWDARSVEVECGTRVEYDLGSHLVVAARGAQRKEQESVPTAEDSTVYGSDRYYALPLVAVEELGKMGRQRMVRITVAPVAYNPVSGTVQSYDQVTIALGAGVERPRGKGAKSYSSCFGDSDIQHYVIVSPTLFREQLQPFASWKRQCGYLVSELYFDGAVRRDSLRSQLKYLYDHATPTRPAPAYVLLVGDEQQIAPFIGREHIAGLSGHMTDLYYGEYSGDLLPDALVGRLPVGDSAQLAAVVGKTLAYERYTMSDSRHLRKALLVAGKEERDPAPAVTNGQVNYLKERLVAFDSTIDTFCYYNPASDTLGDAIYALLDSGVAVVSYSAHCHSGGWMHPDLTQASIDTLSPNGRYCLSINNCCRSNDLSGDSFGKHLIRHDGGGAIGVVGATNETLWEEDYYWNVGVQAALSDHPQYNAAHPGAIDRWLGPAGARAVMQGELILAGNWAVEESGSAYARFYWEIYTLFGDPTLMPYIGLPAPQPLSVVPYRRGDCSVALSGTPYARVGAVSGDSLIAACSLDSDGHGTLRSAMALPDSMHLTATAPFHIPAQQTLAAQPVGGPLLAATAYTLQDDAGEPIQQLVKGDSAMLSVVLRNVGSDTLRGGRCTLTAQSDSVSIAFGGESTHPIALLAPSQDTVLTVKIVATDGETPSREPLITLVLDCCASDTLCRQQRLPIALLHRQLRFGRPLLLRDGVAAAALEAGTTYCWQVTLYNDGQCPIRGLRCTVDGEPCGQTAHLAEGDSLTVSLTLQSGDSVGCQALPVVAEDNSSRYEQAYCYVAGVNTEHFEGGDLAHYPWQGSWQTDSAVAHGGRYAATSRSEGEMAIWVNPNRGDSLVFWARTACGVDERLTMLVDGDERITIGGTSEWVRRGVFLAAGRHLLTWRHEGGGQVWVDDIRFPFGGYEVLEAGYDSVATRPVGVADREADDGVHLYPNPASEQIEICVAEGATVTIYDMAGRARGRFFASGGVATQYSTRHLRCGVYCVVVQTAQRQTVRRLTIGR